VTVIFVIKNIQKQYYQTNLYFAVNGVWMNWNIIYEGSTVKIMDGDIRVSTCKLLLHKFFAPLFFKSGT